jgi:hypothetical protein
MDPQALAEEGLDEPWDPAAETSPCPSASTSTSRFEFSFKQADDTFSPKPSTSHNWTQADIPENAMIDQAIDNLQNILRPKRHAGKGYKNPNLPNLLRGRLELMLGFLRLYKASRYTGWTAHADMMAAAGGKGPWLSRQLRQWSIEFCRDPTNLPTADYGCKNSSILEDEDIRNDIELHLQSLGKWITAMDIVRYVDSPEFQSRLRLKKSITEKTAQRWMERIGFRWGAETKGQYKDGHESEPVVEYRQLEFIPHWREYEQATRHYNTDGEEEDDAQERAFIARPDGKIVVIWRHDESTFYANDRRKIRWIHHSEGAALSAKTEGASFMVGEFVSPDYGWLQGKIADAEGNYPSARVYFRAGKGRDGYQDNSDIIAQVKKAMDILDRDYPNEKHVFAYDNATIHTARRPDALSAKDMQTKPNPNFLTIKKKDGTAQKIIMEDGTFPDGSKQSLYFSSDHPKYPGWFKGMKVLIQERREKGANLPDPSKLKGQCNSKSFKKCPEGRTDCCCRRILFNQPDFVNQKSYLESVCEARGYSVIFFPKFHPELNFIEQCWGFAKRIYRMFPASRLEADLERNTKDSLEAVPLISMRR